MTRVFTGGGWWGALLPVAILVAVLVAVLRSTAVPAPSPTPAPAMLFVPSFERLPPVPGGHYELWVGRPEGGGERLAAFTALPGGALLTLTGEPVQEFPISELPPSGSTLLLTVESGTTPADARGDRVLLEGNLSGLDVKFDAVIPERADGGSVAALVAPTDPAAPDTTGLWFVQPAGKKGSTTAGLRLSPPGPGWAYAGFVTTAAGTVLPTGLFADPKRPDRAAPFSGPRRGLPFPGEDFVRNQPEGVKFPLNLADGRTVIAVSMEPDFTEHPSQPFLPLLTARIAYQQKTSEAFALEPVSADTFPRGSGKFEQRAP